MTHSRLLKVEGLSREYRSGGYFGPSRTVRALDDVTLQMDRGEIFGIVGESGSGKSTLARLVSALDQPTEGNVVFEGDKLFSLSPARLRNRRRDFQMVFQDPYGSLDPRHKVGQIVAEPLYLLDTRMRKSDRVERVASMLEHVGLPASAAQLYPHEFSGGQRQRIAIARALITEPKLLIADEPVSALDVSVQAQILNLLLDLRETRNVAVLFISHNLSVVDCIADRVGVMYRGRLVEIGPASAMFDQPRHPYTRELRTNALSVSIDAARAHSLATAKPRADREGGGGCAYVARCPLAMKRCQSERPVLKSVGTGHAVACHAI